MRAEVVIVGGGPGGAASAMFLAREGIQSMIVERETFPRYHIGESMTGECGAVVRDLGLGDEMLEQRHPMKHGVKVYGQDSWFVPVMGRDEGGNLFDQFTWQVRRSDFDRMMLREAMARGARLVHGQAIKPLIGTDGSVRGVQVRAADGSLVDIQSELVLDCSGQSTFLANSGVTGPKYLGSYDKQIAIFSQVVGGIRDDGGSRESQRDNTLIFYTRKYHWAWWIPLDEEIISVGVVIPAGYLLETKESRRSFLLRELREVHPELSRRLPEIKLVEDVRAMKNYSYQVRRFCGRGFICIGDAHRFVDPIFSFGLYLTMKEAQFAAPAVRAYLEGAHRDAPNPFADHQFRCEQGIDVLEDMIDGFWEHSLGFAILVHHRYREDMIDVFAGRVYDGQPSKGVTGFRRLMRRERHYGVGDEYSVPAGARYHPDRAPLWEVDPPSLRELERLLDL